MTFADDNPLLFHEGELRGALESYKHQIVAAVDEVSEDQFLNTAEQTLIDHFVSKFARTALQIYEDQITADKEETVVDVSHDRDRTWGREGTGPLMVKSLNLTLHIPFTGPIGLWKLRPSRWQTTFPRGRARETGPDKSGEILLIINLPSDAGADKFEYLKNDTLNDIRFYIGSQQTELETFNTKLPKLVQQAIQTRRDKLQAHDDILAALDIPLRPKDDAPAFTPIHVEKVVVPLPPPPKSGYKPEPGINPDIYEFILKVIRSEGRAWEATPKTYAVHDEEELRDIILSHLNTHFLGGATGETFRMEGKTDIRIMEEDRAAFVAECKIWGGEKLLVGALEQLLGYLTWRDCKAALVIFNKKIAGFSGILDKIPAALEGHPNYLRTVNAEPNDEAEWRFVFRSAEDEAREVIVHVSAFNLYVKG